jgi:diguanylate cyclase (GGDEF)-like protein
MKHKSHKYIHVLLDHKGDICHCSKVEREVSGELIKELRIWEKIQQGEECSGTYGEYYFACENIDINSEIFYLITIEKTYTKSISKQSLEHLAYKDCSTGVYNRNLWEHIVEGRVILPDIQHYTIAVIDIDNLKTLNDTSGHLKGDSAIRKVAAIIKEHIRKDDIAIRYGGDEFIILFPNTKNELADNIMERIKNKVDALSFDSDVKVGISAGTASGDEIKGILAVMEKADLSMYEEKAEKNSRVSTDFSDKFEMNLLMSSIADSLDILLKENNKLNF